MFRRTLKRLGTLESHVHGARVRRTVSVSRNGALLQIARLRSHPLTLIRAGLCVWHCIRNANVWLADITAIRICQALIESSQHGPSRRYHVSNGHRTATEEQVAKRENRDTDCLIRRKTREQRETQVEPCFEQTRQAGKQRHHGVDTLATARWGTRYSCGRCVTWQMRRRTSRRAT